MAGGRSTPVCVLPSWMCCFALCVLFPNAQHMEQHTLKRIRKMGAESEKSEDVVVVHVCANVRLTISMSYLNKVKTSQSQDLTWNVKIFGWNTQGMEAWSPSLQHVTQCVHTEFCQVIMQYARKVAQRCLWYSQFPWSVFQLPLIQLNFIWIFQRWWMSMSSSTSSEIWWTHSGVRVLWQMCHKVSLPKYFGY